MSATYSIEAVVGADRCSDRTLDEGRVAQRLERNPEDAVGELLDRFGRELEREARLAASARPRQRQQAVRAYEPSSLFELALPADERRRLDRQVRPIERLQWREVLVAELVQALGRGQVLEAMVAEVTQLRLRCRAAARRLREEYLPAVPGAHDPRRPMDVDADVSLLGDDRLAGVDADPHAHGPVRQRVLGVSSRGDRIGGARERNEERVPLSVHLDSLRGARTPRATARRCSASTSA